MRTQLPTAKAPAESGKTIWVFTPSRTDPKDLEFILVQRQKLLQDAVERVKESALTDHKHHLLFVGPRGCGKTHFVTLLVNRLNQDDELTNRLRIAWLNEDETCTTLLELLFKIHAALEKRYPAEFNGEMIAAAFELKQDAAREFMLRHLLASAGSHTLLVVTENLDTLFEELGQAGQKQLRSLIQENPRFSIVATAQRLVADLTSRTSPFFGFFQTEHLKPLSIEQAIELLQNIARLQKKEAVVELLATRRGHSRVRAIHHLSGGNQRIYIVLSQFISRDSVDALLEPFMKMVDELTPYYQERIRWLPPMQRKIVEYLCVCEGTVAVKEIAKRLFATPQTISSQLQDLREKGYVEASQRGRESLYEVCEPLMRICVEVKDNQRLQPLRLLVDFLRVWYEDHELKNRLEMIEPASNAYALLISAIERNSTEGNLRTQILFEDLELWARDHLPNEERDGAVEGLKNQPEGVLLALQSINEGQTLEAMRCLDEAIEQGASVVDMANLLLCRAALHSLAKERRKEIADYTAVIGLLNVPVVLAAKAQFARGVANGLAGDEQLAIADFTAVAEMHGAPTEKISEAHINRGVAHGRAGDVRLEIGAYTGVINLVGASVEIVARAHVYRGVTLGQSGDLHLAIADFTAVIDKPHAPTRHLAKALVCRGIVFGKTGNAQLEIADYTTVIDLPDAPAEEVAKARFNRGVAHGKKGDVQSEIADYTAVIDLPSAPAEERAKAHINRAVTYGNAGDVQREIADYTAVIDLPSIPIEFVALALYLRGITFAQSSQKQKAQSDFETLIGLAEAPVQLLVNAHLALAALEFSENRWAEGLSAVEASLERGATIQPVYHATPIKLIGVLFSAGLSLESRRDKVPELLRIYGNHQALSILGEAVVQHIGRVFQLGEPFPAADNLEGWASVWEHAAASVPDFRLSVRLLRTGIDYVKAGGKDPGILLVLTSSERVILEQALGLAEKADNPNLGRFGESGGRNLGFMASAAALP